MKCLNPLTIRNPKINKGVRDTAFITIPCGKCPACLSTRITDWTNRIKDEMRNNYYSCGYFVTLTYEQRPKEGVNKKHVQDFLKRLRHCVDSFKYYLISEYGPNTRRPHYHMILLCNDTPDKVIDAIGVEWKFGFTEVSPVSEERIKYVTSYHATKNSYDKGFEYPDMETGELIKQNDVFCLMSKKLGASQIEYEKQVKGINHNYIMRNGVRYHLPKYYKDKLYTETEKKNIRDYFANMSVVDDSNAIDYLNMYKNYEHFCRFFNEYVVKKKSHKERRI